MSKALPVLLILLFVPFKLFANTGYSKNVDISHKSQPPTPDLAVAIANECLLHAVGFSLDFSAFNKIEKVKYYRPQSVTKTTITGDKNHWNEVLQIWGGVSTEFTYSVSTPNYSASNIPVAFDIQVTPDVANAENMTIATDFKHVDLSVRLRNEAPIPYQTINVDGSRTCEIDSWGVEKCTETRTVVAVEVIVPDGLPYESTWLNVDTGNLTKKKINWSRLVDCYTHEWSRP